MRALALLLGAASLGACAGWTGTMPVSPPGPKLILSAPIQGPHTVFARASSGWERVSIAQLPAAFVCRPAEANDTTAGPIVPGPVIAVGQAVVLEHDITGPFEVLKAGPDGAYQPAVAERIPAGYLCQGVRAPGRAKPKPKKKRKKKGTDSVEGD